MTSVSRPANDPATISDRGLERLVREVMLECVCERGRPRSGCEPPLDRGWIVSTMLDDEQQAALASRRARQNLSKPVLRPRPRERR
jgi:hypothetical protein